MQVLWRALPARLFSLGLAFWLCCCGVGSVGQTTSSTLQTSPSAQQQASAPSSGAAGNTTGAVNSGATSTTGDAGTTTAGAPTVGPTTGTTTGATTGGNGNSTSGGNGNATNSGNGNAINAGNGNQTAGQDSNATLLDISGLQHYCCYYDTQKNEFALSLSNDAQYCSHAAAGELIMQEHSLLIAAQLSQLEVTVKTGNANDKQPAQPKSVTASIALYSNSCVLQSQGKSLSGSVSLTQADSTSCSGSYTLSMQQTTPSLGSEPTTLTGSFAAAPSCTTLTARTSRNKCL